MSTIFEHTLTVFMAFFAIMNPIANTAVFAGLTSGIGKEAQRKVAFKALFITFIIILFFLRIR
jgi:multiple antibiotic resistance protein